MSYYYPSNPTLTTHHPHYHHHHHDYDHQYDNNDVATPIHPPHSTFSWEELPHKIVSVFRQAIATNLTTSSHPHHQHHQHHDNNQQTVFWDLDLNRISRRVNHEFFPHAVGPPPFASIHIVHFILLLGLLVGLVYLLLALVYHTMQKIRAFCPALPSFKRKSKRDRGRSDVESGPPKELPTPEVLEARRQERLSFLQKECDHLETQLTAEKQTSLTSRASDSDLEYLGYADEDSPPLKRNSISLQDIPQSVVKIRREKQLRQLKEEIEHLHALSQSQDLDKDPGPLSSRSPLLKDLHFNYPIPRSKSSSPSPVDSGHIITTEHLSQRISHLKAQRRLQALRTDLEGLALHLVHSDDIRAKTSSLQDLPRTALGAKRHKELLTIAKEIEHVKSYKLQQKTILSAVLPPPKPNKAEITAQVLAKLNQDQATTVSSYRSPTLAKKEIAATTPSSITSGGPLQRQTSTAESVNSVATNPNSNSGDTASITTSASLRRTRAQELNRVRVELKELSYKLNLNYVFDVEGDREKIFPADWPKQCSFSKDSFK
ncbi:uncharacterized protein LOC118438488 isoform X2 [Folsomia candida]|uniref:uncharacterized protein LOC118438488 isoform X2 n=1 Tax=Folsomia candida TaxID=158441 RepID=UPI001604F972|nr:uncharacterized protein LOC118438488 isoform X2 [Folsomia candida]